MNNIIEEVYGFYKIIKLANLRRTIGVKFDVFPPSLIPKIDAVDRVIHINNAVSPGEVENVKRPWYMHPYQDDNLIVLHGTRNVDIYSVEYSRVENFIVTPDSIIKNGKLIYEGGAVLVWPRHVFHRIISGAEGSASLNLATHYKGFSIENNFNIYDLDTKTGKYRTIREGFLDQKRIK